MMRAAAPLLLLLAACAPGLRARFEEVAGPPPAGLRPVPFDVRVEEEVRLETHVRRRISFAVEEGDRVPAYLLVPHGLTGPAPAALCLHQTTAMGKAEPAGMGKPDLAYAAELAARGWVTLAPDYPNFGDYRVDPYARGWASGTRKGIWNHQRAVDLLASMGEVDPARLAAVGHSLGGHNALFLALFDDRIRAVVTSCGFCAFPRYKQGNLAGWSSKVYMPRIAEAYGKDPARLPFDFPELLAALAPRGLFIHAPLGDHNFDVQGVRDCVAAARPAYAARGAEDRLVALHPEGGHDFPPSAREQAYLFLERALIK
jgi:dienelactone hydrolase